MELTFLIHSEEDVKYLRDLVKKHTHPNQDELGNGTDACFLKCNR